MICSQVGFIARVVVPHIPEDGLLVPTSTRISRRFQPLKLYVQQFITATDTNKQKIEASSPVASDVILDSVTRCTGEFQWNGDRLIISRTHELDFNCARFSRDRDVNVSKWAECYGDTYLNFVILPSMLKQLLWVPPTDATLTVVVAAQLLGEIVETPGAPQ